MCHMFIHSSVDGHGCLHVLAIVNNAVVSMGCMHHFELWFSTLLLSNIPLFGCKWLLFIHLLKDVWVVISFCPFKIKLIQCTGFL